MEENAIQINGGITINFDVNVKTLMYIKKIMFGILVNVFVKMENIQQTLWIIYDEVIKSYEQNIKTILTNFNEKKVTCKKAKFLYFTCFFINYYTIIDSC